MRCVSLQQQMKYWLSFQQAAPEVQSQSNRRLGARAGHAPEKETPRGQKVQPVGSAGRCVGGGHAAHVADVCSATPAMHFRDDHFHLHSTGSGKPPQTYQYSIYSGFVRWYELLLIPQRANQSHHPGVEAILRHWQTISERSQLQKARSIRRGSNGVESPAVQRWERLSQKVNNRRNQDDRWRNASLNSHLY